MSVEARVPQPDDAAFGAERRSGFPDEATTYYERPLLKAPHWEWNVVTYLFLGGIMGGLGLLQALARDNRGDERRMRRSARFAALVLAAANPAILITHLGRPERFFNMMRIVKFKSPMSMGAWGLVAYSGFAGMTAVREAVDIGAFPPWMRALAPTGAGFAQAFTGAFMAGYTGVLLSATANPLWSSGKRHIPAFCVCSGIAGACALSGVLASLSGNHRIHRKLELLEIVAGMAELTLLSDFKRHGAAYAAPMFEGARGARLRSRTVAAGIVVPAVLNMAGALLPLPKRLDGMRSFASSALTLFGGYALRESLIESGKASARDPRAASHQPR